MLRSYLEKINRFLQKSLILMLRGYQYLISPILGNRCRFYPSCSHYAVEALSQFNIIKGSYLTLRRLARCHPFNPGGYDPLVRTEKQHHLTP